MNKYLKVLGINVNFCDTTRFINVKFSGGHACQKFNGNNNGTETPEIDNIDKDNASWTCQ